MTTPAPPPRPVAIFNACLVLACLTWAADVGCKVYDRVVEAAGHLPAPAPTPPPAPAPAPGPIPDHPPTPPPAPAGRDFAMVGRVYAPALAGTYADQFDAAADRLEKGAKFADIWAGFEGDWKAARAKALAGAVAPAFSAVIKPGEEPATPEKRAEVVAMWRAFARGLRGGR